MFFRYSCVLIQTLVRVIFSLILVCIFFRYSSVLIQTLARVKPFFNTRMYLLSILYRIDSNTSLGNILFDTQLYLLFILVRIDSNTRRVIFSLILVCILFKYSSVLIQHSFVLNLSFILILIFFRYTSILIQTLVR